MIYLFSFKGACWVGYLFFTSYSLARSTTLCTEHHVWSVSTLQVRGSVSLNQFTYHLLALGYPSRERRVDLLQLYSDLDPNYICRLGPPLFLLQWL